MVINKKTLLLITYYLVLIGCGVMLFPLWGVLLSAWASITLFIVVNKLTQSLSTRQIKLFWIIAIGYPLVETFIKFLILQEAVDISYLVLNILEHSGFSFSLAILLFPLLKPWLTKLPYLAQLLFVLGIVVILGNFNEFLEYFIRVIIPLKKNFDVYYADTIRDLIMNMIGAVLGFATLRRSLSKQARMQ